MAETAVTLYERDGTLTRVLPAVRPDGWPGRLIVTADTPSERWPCTMSDMEERKAALFNALQGADLTLDHGQGEIVFALAHAMAVWREDEDRKSGEISFFSWMVLRDKDGNTFGSSSKILPHQVSRLYDHYPQLHTGGHVWVRIKWRVPKRGVGPYHTLQVLTRVQAGESGDAAE